MKYLVAVSGGVDSVALLDMLVKEDEHELIVAHFDHGIRDDSASDATFVGELARSYGLPFETRREVLGRNASEELARDRRYTFLRGVADNHNATIVTAHHMHDIAETIAINLSRGTGWRGAAVLASDVHRPLVAMTKPEIMAYAKQNKLEWREDSTNASDAYLRNRLRRKITNKNTILELATLRARQVELRDSIDDEVAKIIGGTNEQSRYFFTQIPSRVAIELLRGLAIKHIGYGLPRPQLDRALHAIKTAQAGTKFPFGEAWLHIDKKAFRFSVKTP